MFGESSVALIIFVISCTSASARFLSDDRIVGGYPVNITQHPYHVAIIYDYRDFCGGSIISNRWILTGAHCIKPDYALDYKVLVGATDKFTEGVEYDVESFEVHPKFNRENYDYDFGLIRLKEEMQFHESAQPVQLPKVGDGFDFVTGTWLVVTGFGHTSLSGDTTRYLQALKVPTVNQQLCKKSYYGLVTTRMFCAGFYYDGGADMCNGDTGGPLIIVDDETKTPIQYGIVSWGKACGIARAVAVYAKIPAARKWIQQLTGI